MTFQLKFSCKTPSENPQCVSRMSVCDGRDDCDDGSDESFCKSLLKNFESTIDMKLMSDESNSTLFYSTIPYEETTTQSGKLLYFIISVLFNSQNSFFYIYDPWYKIFNGVFPIFYFNEYLLACFYKRYAVKPQYLNSKNPCEKLKKD